MHRTISSFISVTAAVLCCILIVLSSSSYRVEATKKKLDIMKPVIKHLHHLVDSYNNKNTKKVRGGEPTVNPCLGHPASFTWCNTSLPLEQRVKSLVDAIPQDQMFGLFGNGMAGSKSINFPDYQVWSEALHGVAMSSGVSFTDPTPCATSFPQVCTTGASFNKKLFHDIGDVVGREGRAFNNYGHAGLTFWAPNLNAIGVAKFVWGRAQEVPSEDPVHVAAYGVNFIRGAQNNSDDPTRLRVSFCAKHQILYGEESWGGIDRHHFDAVVDKSNLEENYLPMFEAAAKKEGGAVSQIMCSYNSESVVGDPNMQHVPSCANKEYLTDILRGKWGFDGFVTSDCGAVADVYQNHKFVKTPEEACGAVLSAGMDSDCGGVLSTYLDSALKNGNVTISQMKFALSNIFRVFFRLGMFDPDSSQPYKKYSTKDINTPEAQHLAYQAALEGITLLQYDATRFPLDATNIKNVLVAGPNAQNPIEQVGNYAGRPCSLVTPREALETLLGKSHVTYEKGCDIRQTDATSFDSVCATASNKSVTDAVVLVMGIDQLVESEGHDRTSVALPGLQNLFVSTIARCAAKSGAPVVVVTMNGGPLDVSQILNTPNIAAVMGVGYPSQAGGTAIADVIFGRASPSGRLIHTIPKQESFAAHFNDWKMDMEAKKTIDDGKNSLRTEQGFGYKYFTGERVFSFGHGLTFTTWGVKFISQTAVRKITSADLNNKDVPATMIPIVSLTFNVTNVGTKFASKFSLLLFVMPPDAAERGIVMAPLADFEKTSLLAPGQSEVVTVTVSLYSVLHTGRTVRAGDYTWAIQDFPEQRGEFYVA